MKNKLTDLNDHLFEQLERLADGELSGEALDAEIKRTTAVVELADTIVANAQLQFMATKFVVEHSGGDAKKRLPAMLGITAGDPQS